MKEIYLPNGIVTLVSDIDFEWILETFSSIHLFAKGYVGCEIRGDSYKTLYLHREIGKKMGYSQSKIIDHKDKNKLNNQRDNLRECTYSQNNAHSIPKSKLYEYKGIYKHTQQRSRPWYAEITCKGERSRLGNFETKEEAARAYDVAALRLFGEYAYTNFPREDYL
jgi:hypothetical protein